MTVKTGTIEEVLAMVDTHSEIRVCYNGNRDSQKIDISVTKSAARKSILIYGDVLDGKITYETIFSTLFIGG